MGLKYGDLKDTVLKSIQIDTFVPKTGESEDTIVVAIQTPEKGAGNDIYSYFNNGSKDIKDVDVSPNKNDDHNYMVFIEIDRNEKAIELIRNLIKDLENLTGKLNWQGTTHIHDEPFPIDENLGEYVMTDPQEYMSRKEWEEKNNNQLTDSIMAFLSPSSLQNVSIVENKISMQYYDTSADLEIVNFGPAHEIMKDIGIAESALRSNDTIMNTFNKMLGEMRAVRIDEYIVVFHPEQNDVLVARECSQ